MKDNLKLDAMYTEIMHDIEKYNKLATKLGGRHIIVQNTNSVDYDRLVFESVSSAYKYLRANGFVLVNSPEGDFKKGNTYITCNLIGDGRCQLSSKVVK